MFSCNNLSLTVGKEKTKILDNASAQFGANKLHAVIGPSGCGKTTLVKSMLRIYEAEGEVKLGSRLVESSEDLTGAVSFAPQFSIAPMQLSVEEAIHFSLRLNVREKEIRESRFDHIVRVTGLTEHKEKKVGSLSGGQLRRVGLALELTNDPDYLVCDEVTSGLDPLSEDHILQLLRNLQQEDGKTFICIIHNLAKLDQFDQITVVFKGKVIFQGDLHLLKKYFEIKDALYLYDRLSQQDLSYWVQYWDQNKEALMPQDAVTYTETEKKFPGVISQFITLTQRRFSLFFRDWGYLGLTMAITFGFPILVVIFALDGLPQIRSGSLSANTGIIQKFQENIELKIESLEISSLITGLVMFQVVLLSLMGANNGAREIAGERNLFEKERLSGLKPLAYVGSKLLFVSMIAAFQGAWMTLFVKSICEFPGSWLEQISVLSLTCVTMTVICLGFSALFPSAEKASILSIYLVGFQLPLSGIVLALPEYLVWFCRPFISAFWGWAGFVFSMKDSRFYDAMQMTEALYVPTVTESLLVLGIQLIVGVWIVCWGCYRKESI
jgi:ABC-type multidrug transport system ATPase subunit